MPHSLFVNTLAIDGTVVLVGVLALFVGVGLGVFLSRYIASQTIGRANAEAQRLVESAKTESQTIRQKAEVDAEKLVLSKKEAFEAEAERSRAQMRESERRLTKREDFLDKKLESLDRKEEALESRDRDLSSKLEAAEAKSAELDALVAQEIEKLSQVAQMTIEEAKSELLERVEQDTRHEMAKVVARAVQEAEDQAQERSREITVMAIQRYATEHTAEATTRAVTIPSDDMKGRIIGREGRNIRAIEKVTGVDIIVDDTPGVIVVSCFDKIRQAVAVESLNRLIADGRMHPTRIEEVVEKVKAEFEEKVIKAGKDAAMEVNLRGLHPKVIEAMGKLAYRTSYSQNVLRHSVEVAFLSQIIAEQLGMDGRLARRAGFLHDIGKAMDHELEGGHPKIGMEFAKQYGEKEPVLNVIGGHHGDIPSTSFYTPIVMAADAVSSARPGARRESMEKYVQRLTQLQDIALEHQGVTEAYAIQAGREVRVMVDARKVGDDEAQSIAFNIAKKVSEEMTFPGEIRVTVLRETRAIEFAR